MKYWNRLVTIMCAKMLVYVLKKRPEILKKYIQESAIELAPQIAQSMIRSRGFHTCFRCPQTYSLRKRTDGQYACSNHQQEVKAAVAA